MEVQRLADAIRTSWCRETCSEPGKWSEANRSRDQCDVTGLVVMHYLGGDLQIATVSSYGEQTGYHYWNRLTATESIDLTQEQFRDDEVLGEPSLVKRSFILEQLPTARQELRDRYELLSAKVRVHLGAGSSVLR